MKCPFCAEEIRDEAVLCRFCGASRVDGEWRPPRFQSSRQPAAVKGALTFRVAAVFFFLSALLEVLSLTAAVPLFGDVRGGAWAAIYHGIYTALFVALGVGLLGGKPWGYRFLVAGTIFYTADRLRLVLDRAALEAWVRQSVAGYEEVFELVDLDSWIRLTVISCLLFVAAWWAFVLWARARKSWFERPSNPPVD